MRMADVCDDDGVSGGKPEGNRDLKVPFLLYTLYATTENSFKSLRPVL